MNDCLVSSFERPFCSIIRLTPSGCTMLVEPKDLWSCDYSEAFRSEKYARPHVGESEALLAPGWRPCRKCCEQISHTGLTKVAVSLSGNITVPFLGEKNIIHFPPSGWLVSSRAGTISVLVFIISHSRTQVSHVLLCLLPYSLFCFLCTSLDGYDA